MPGAAAPAPSVQATSSLVRPAMAETTTATWWPAADLGGDQPGDAADALQVGHRGAAEFHHDAGQARCSSSEGRPSSDAASAGQG